MVYFHSVHVNCFSYVACGLANIYCPETENCFIYCTSSGCVGAPIYTYLSDPDYLYDDSLLSTTCESDDCLIEAHFCGNVSDITTCIWSESMYPLTCNSTDCNVCRHSAFDFDRHKMYKIYWCPCCPQYRTVPV